MKRDRAVDSLRFLLILLVFITHLLSLYSPDYLAPWIEGDTLLDGWIPWRGGTSLINGITGNFAVCFFTLLIGYFAGGASKQPLEKRVAKRYLQFFLGMAPPLAVAFVACFALDRGLGISGTMLGAYCQAHSFAAGALQCLNDAVFFESTLIPTYWCMGTFFLGSVAVMTLSAVQRERPVWVRTLWGAAALAACVLTGSWLLGVCVGGYLLRLLEPRLRAAFERGWVRAVAVLAAVLIVRAPDFTTRCYLQGVAGALLLLSLKGAPRVSRALSWRPLARAGEASFYFYLWHTLVQDAFHALCWPGLLAYAGEAGRWWITLLAAVCTLAISLVISLAHLRAHEWLMARFFPGLSARPAEAAPAEKVPVSHSEAL